MQKKKEKSAVVETSEDVMMHQTLCYWTTVDEANGITTLNVYMDKLALSKDWGNRNTVKVARVPAGTEIRSFSN